MSDVVDPTTRQTTRTVYCTNYVDENGLILDVTESSSYGPSQTRVTYLADIDATGQSRGSLDANAVYTLLPTDVSSKFV